MKLKELLKRKDNPKETNLVVLWKSNKISPDDILKRYATGFLSAAVYYYGFIDSARERVEMHNENCEKYQKAIDKLLSGIEYEGVSLDKMLLEIHKKDKSEILDILINDRFLDVLSGMSTIMGMRECNEHKHCELLAKDNLIEKCLLPEVVSIFKEEEKGLPFEDGRIPTREEMSFFYDACLEAVEVSEIAKKEDIPFLPEIIFSPNGVLLKRDNEGHQVPAEDDVVAQLIELDYKEVV